MDTNIPTLLSMDTNSRTIKLQSLDIATLETIQAEARITGKAQGGNFNRFYDLASEVNLAIIHNKVCYSKYN